MFEYLATKLLVPLDQLYFIFAQLLALLLGWAYRHQFGHVDRLRQSDRNLRLTLLAVTGLGLCFFLFGFQVIHMINLAGGAYFLIVALDSNYQHLIVLIFSLIYLSYLHLNRLIYDFNSYNLDVTAPIMIMVQKVTLVAFSLHDGRSERYRQLAEKEDITTNDQKKDFEVKHNVLLGKLLPLEYVAYIFNFPTVLCGPSTFYGDFIDFVDGRRLHKAQLKKYPSVGANLLHRITICNLCSILIVLVGNRFPILLLKEPRFFEANFLTKLVYLILVTSLARLKYYFAWSMSEAIGNLAGLGFNGFDSKGQARWDLLNNVEIFAFENALSQKNAIEAWNKSTDRWLRKIVYERTPKQWRLLATFILSAIWHGFFPGYYLTFLSGALFTLAARNVRRYIRPYFVKDPSRHLTYNVVTYLTTRVAIAYLVFPFVLLEWQSSWIIYRQLYFFVHIAAFAAWLILPSIARLDKMRTTSIINTVNSVQKQSTVTAAIEEKSLVDYLGQQMTQTMPVSPVSSF